MTGLVRSACLTHYSEVARSLGLDPLAQLRAVELDARCLQEPDLKIPVQKVARLLEDSARLAGVQDFGLRMAETRTLSNLGPLALLLRDEPTLRSALTAVRDYLYLHNEGLVLLIEENHGVAVLRTEQVAVGRVPVRQAMELSIAVVYRLLRQLLGAGWAPRAVCFSHAAPADTSIYRRIFGAPVQFNSVVDGIVCRSSDLDRALPSADPEVARYVHQYLQGIREESRTAPVEQVRRLIWMLLPGGRCSLSVVASHLGRDRRTLHRQLEREGQSYTALLEQVREELALRHLENRERPLAEIAGLLGFSAPSAFSRWFRQRQGRSPRAWRAALSTG
jgi:AraC-like DNA-binding protein